MSKETASGDGATLLVIGKVTGVHGLAGNLKVWSFAEGPGTFSKGVRVFLRTEGTAGLDEFSIRQVSERKKGILLGLSGITNRNQADELMGKEILIRRDQLPEPEEDAWYWQDLYGSSVTDEALGALGTVESIFPTGASDMLVVKDGDRETLVPMHRQFVVSVDLDAGTIITRLPEGFDTL